MQAPGCACRMRSCRSEVAQLAVSDIQKRDERWVIVDLYGKGGHIRTVPVPEWVKTAIDCWTTAARVTSGRIFRCVSKTGTVWGEGVSEKVIWCVVKEFASKAQLGNLAPHDLRRTCARLCHVAGGELTSGLLTRWPNRNRLPQMTGTPFFVPNAPQSCRTA